jgi:hypothetical protein
MTEASSVVAEESQPARRLRRLRELSSQMSRVNEAVRQVWDQPDGSRPAMIRIRPGFLVARGAGDERRGAPMSNLLNSRGIALRLYLLALYEAQCRPASAEPSQNTRPLAGRRSWGELIAIDAAWSQPDKAYLHHSIQNRDLDTSRDRQVKGALRTLEGHGDQSLVEVPFKANGRHRDYARFRLMAESGRGGTLTPEYYTMPGAGEPTISIPCQFFLRGWIQILYPSEIATWLALRVLRAVYPVKHNESGVFLYGQYREHYFRLLRDTYEDGCRNLVDFGLIRHARPDTPDPSVAPQASDWVRWFMTAMALPETDEDGRVRYKPNRYQLTDEGLERDALGVSMPTIQARRNEQ